MFLCLNDNEQQYGTGRTLELAHKDLCEYFGNPYEVSDCTFHQLPDTIEVEVKIVPKETIVKKKV